MKFRMDKELVLLSTAMGRKREGDGFIQGRSHQPRRGLRGEPGRVGRKVVEGGKGERV